jgi:hypothetical protein
MPVYMYTTRTIVPIWSMLRLRYLRNVVVRMVLQEHEVAVARYLPQQQQQQQQRHQQQQQQPHEYRQQVVLTMIILTVEVTPVRNRNELSFKKRTVVVTYAAATMTRSVVCFLPPNVVKHEAYPNLGHAIGTPPTTLRNNNNENNSSE